MVIYLLTDLSRGRQWPLHKFVSLPQIFGASESPSLTNQCRILMYDKPRSKPQAEQKGNYLQVNVARSFSLSKEL